jgi:hypothetical protein
VIGTVATSTLCLHVPLAAPAHHCDGVHTTHELAHVSLLLMVNQSVLSLTTALSYAQRNRVDPLIQIVECDENRDGLSVE